MSELDEWDEDEELGSADLETRLDAALDRAFPRPRLCLTCKQALSLHKGFSCPDTSTPEQP
jgi:hypothetical protein